MYPDLLSPSVSQFVSPAIVGFLGEMLGFQFMQRAIVAGVCVAVVAPLVGSFLVHRGMAMMGETLAHTAFAGVAAGLFLGSTMDVAVSPYLTAVVVAVVAALLVQVLAERTDVYGDVSMMIVLAGGFASGSVLVSFTDGGIAVSIDQYLFGNLATLGRSDVAILVSLSAVVVVAVLLSYRQLVYLTFDETGARVAGVNATRVTRLLVALTALVVVGAMQMMGVILVAAMLVIPVAAAAQVAGSFRSSILLSVVVAQLSVLVGTTVSYASGAATGGTIVLVAIALYLLSALVGSAGFPRAG